jgi:hypothetical protein
MVQTPEQIARREKLITEAMDRPYVVARDPSAMPRVEERVSQALDYIAYQLFKIREALEK